MNKRVLYKWVMLFLTIFLSVFSGRLASQEIRSSYVLDVIQKNELSAKFHFSPTTLVEIDTVRNSNENTCLKFNAIFDSQDSVFSSFNGCLTDSSFYFEGPFKYNVIEEGINYTYLGEIKFDQINGFLLKLLRKPNKVSTIEYYQNGTKEMQMDLIDGYLRYFESSMSQDEIIGKFLLGKLKFLFFYSKEGTIRSSIELGKNGEFKAKGNFSKNVVQAKIVKKFQYYLFEDSLYTTPFEFSSHNQAMYIQDAVNTNNMIPLRQGTWFIAGNNNEIRFVEY